MRKISVLLVLAGLLIVKSNFANQADLFAYDAKKVDKELAVLDAVEQFVDMNRSLTYSEMTQMNNPLASDLKYGATGSFGIQMIEPVAGIPSFLWGLVLNVGGVLIVYLVTEDNEETKKAAYGCAAGTVLIGCLAFALPLLFGVALVGV